MKKRILAIIMAMTLGVGALAGCGSSDSSSDTDTEEAQDNSETSQVEKEGDPTKIVLELLCFDSVPADLELVEDAINELTIPEINVEVELYPVLYTDASTEVSLMISSGSQLDLVVSLSRSDFLSLVNKNMLLSLDDLYEEYGIDIKANAENAVPGGYVGDTLYGIPSVEKYGRTYGLMTLKEAADAVGWDKYEDVTMEEMGEYLALLKEAYPDQSGIHMNSGDALITIFEYFYPIDLLGADAACGGIFGVGEDEGSEIVNIYATDEYMEFCKTMREWYLAGYINADATTSTDSSQTVLQSGSALSFFLQTELDMVSSQSSAIGEEVIALNTRSHDLTQGDINASCWSIAYTCENPEKAMQLLNMMWGSEDLINLLYYGVEGQDYVFMDDDSGRIDYPEGQNAQTVGYHQWFGVYGDTSQKLTWSDSDADYHEQLVAFNADVDDSNTSKYLGYSFDTNEVKTAYSAVTDAISTYRTALECGSVDPEEVIPQFLEALESAGIDEIIEANQASLDAWIAAQ